MEAIFLKLQREGKVSKGKISHCASGVHRIKKLHNTKSYCLMVTFNSCFMQDPQIPNFYITNLKTQPFNGKLDWTVEPRGCMVLKSCIKPNVNV